jgi:rare lipoprotein A
VCPYQLTPLHKAILFGVVAIVAGCQRRDTLPQPPPKPHYVVGAPWQGATGAWFYPKEQLDYHASGLATVETIHPQHVTADGEPYNPQAVTASHQTLQLPSVVRVTDLENGRQIILRVTDRGPSDPGRILGLTPQAGLLLGIQPGTPARVTIDLDVERSRAVGGGPHIDLVAAPVVGVQEETLGPTGSVGHDALATGQRTSPAMATPNQDPQADQRLPVAVQQGSPNPGALWIDAGRFGRKSYADQIAADIGGIVRSEGQGRQILYLVRLGPFQRTADADAALDRARHAGVTGAHIIVE